jgi:hypothetical protein
LRAQSPAAQDPRAEGAQAPRTARIFFGAGVSEPGVAARIGLQGELLHLSPMLLLGARGLVGGNSGILGGPSETFVVLAPSLVWTREGSFAPTLSAAIGPAWLSEETKTFCVFGGCSTPAPHHSFGVVASLEFALLWRVGWFVIGPALAGDAGSTSPAGTLLLHVGGTER